MVGVDLTDIVATEQALLASGVRRDVPTFVLSECVLTYIDPNLTNKVERKARKQGKAATGLFFFIKKKGGMLQTA